MGKVLFVLEVAEPEPRKPQAPPVRKHKSRKLYSRKAKHKGVAGDPREAGGFFMHKLPPSHFCFEGVVC